MSESVLSDKDKEVLMGLLKREVIRSIIIDSIIYTEVTFAKEIYYS